MVSVCGIQLMNTGLPLHLEFDYLNKRKPGKTWNLGYFEKNLEI